MGRREELRERERSLKTKKGKERTKRKGEERRGGRGGEESHLTDLLRRKEVFRVQVLQCEPKVEAK